MNEITSQGSAFLDQFRQWDFLWKEDLEKSFKKFLEGGEDLKEIFRKKMHATHVGEDEEDYQNHMKEAMDKFDFMNNKILDGVTTRQPDLAEFDKKIEYLHSVKQQIDGQKLVHDIGWLKVVAQSLVNRLHETITAWIEKYTQYLLNNTMQEISNITNFID
jgi:hypothetical protein